MEEVKIRKKSKRQIIIILIIIGLFYFFFNTSIDKKSEINLENDVILPLFSQINEGLLWNRTWGGSAEESFHDIAYDDEGNIYITGYTASYGAGSDDIIILKYNPEGDSIWNRTWGSTELDRAEAIAVDNESNVYITGYTKGFGASINDMVLLKYNSSGDKQWEKVVDVSSGEYERGLGLVIDNSSNLIVVGHRDIPGGGGGSEIFITKYNSTGDQQWLQSWGQGTGYVITGEDIALDKFDFIYVTGYRYHSFQGRRKIVKFNPDGDYVWHISWAWHSDDWGRSTIAIDNASEYIYCVGYGGGSLFLFKYDVSGNFVKQIWDIDGSGNAEEKEDIRPWEENNTVRLKIIMDPYDNIYVPTFTGNYKNGVNDLILFKFDESLNKIWNITWGGNVEDFGFGVGINFNKSCINIIGKKYSICGSGDGLLLNYPLPIIHFEKTQQYLNSTNPLEMDLILEINCSLTSSSPLKWVYLNENSSGIYINRSMQLGVNGEYLSMNFCCSKIKKYKKLIKFVNLKINL